MELHRVGGNPKRCQQSTNAEHKSIETVISIPFCRECGDKWQSKTLFLTIFDLRSSIVLAFSIAAYRSGKWNNETNRERARRRHGQNYGIDVRCLCHFSKRRCQAKFRMGVAPLRLEIGFYCPLYQMFSPV